MTEGPPKPNEEWRASVSVSMILEVTTITRGELDDIPRLLLVRDREAKKWSVPAGHIKPNETFGEALTREFGEETGLPQYALDLRPSISTFQETGGMMVTPINLPGETKSRVGLVYNGGVRDLKDMPNRGWKVTGDEDTDRAKPFNYKEVMALIDSGAVHRENLNAPLLISWLVKLHNSLGTGGFKIEAKEELSEWLLNNKKIEEYGLIWPDEVLPRDVVRFVPSYLIPDFELYKTFQLFDGLEFRRQVARLK
jgi:8-oxo-dGTP pyrophosphatase MutT (NUDIX family)